MMSALGYIAGTLLAPNLAGYLLAKGITSREEKRLINEIESGILEFNTGFNDTEVDSNYFVEFLEQSDVRGMIFERVFNAYKSSSVDFDNISSELGEVAVEFVNKKKDEYNHPHVKLPSDFKDYFVVLFKTLINIRESLLSIKDKALVSTINDSMGFAENRIISEILKQGGDNILLENRIKEIELLIDKGRYNESLDMISDVFELVASISSEQRAKLLYQKARIFINDDKFEKVQEIRKKISQYSSDSRFLDEIDYWLGFKNNDIKKVYNSIEQLRIKGVCDEELKLKLTNFYIMESKYDEVIREICNGNGEEISERYRKYASAYYQVGVVYAVQGKFEIARSLFSNALDKKYNIVYEYNLAMTSASAILEKIKFEHKVDEKVKSEAESISSKLNEVRYFINDGLKEARLQYWWNYLNLLGLYNHSLIIDEYECVHEDLKGEELIAVIVSEAYYLSKRFREALPFLEKIWKLDSLFLSRLMHVYSEFDTWDLIDELFKKDITHLIDSEGNIFFYKVESLSNKGDVSGSIDLIRNEGDIYKSQLWFQKRVLEFANDNGVSELYDEFVKYILMNIDAMDSNMKVSLAKSFFNHAKYFLVQEVLKTTYKYSQEAVEMYIHSFGEVNPNSDNFDDLRDAVIELYKEGNHSKYLLQSKFYIEFFTHRYDDAKNSLEKYRELYDKDMFYNLNTVQITIFSSSDYDAIKECESLKLEDNIKYQIMVAQYLGYKGRWNEAKEHLSNSFYRLNDQIGEEEIAGFVQIYLLNLHQDTDEVEYIRACNDSVVVLENEDGGIKCVSINSNESIIHQNGEDRLGCFNYKGSSDEALMLKAISKKGSQIAFVDTNYQVKEILNLHTFHFRYFYQKLLVEFPNNNTLTPISGKSIEELVEKMTEIMAASQKNFLKKLDLYNFEVQTGIPISYLSDKNNGKYLEVIDFLLANSKQNFYSSYSTRDYKNSKYVLTISSIMILKYLGLLDKLSSIKNKLIVPASVKSFIRKGLNDSIKYDAVVSTAYLDDNDEFRIIESTEDNKEFRRNFWTELLLRVNSLQVERPESINYEVYDKLHELVDVSEFEAIKLAEDVECTFVCDDLFIAKLSESVNGSAQILNAIGLLYIEDLLTYNELLNVALKVSQFKMINCVNHKILYDIYLNTVNKYGSEEFNVHYPIVKEIFHNLFNESTKGFNQFLYQRFIEETMRNGKISGLLYKILEKPLGFIPYEEFIANALNNMKIEFKIFD